MKKNQISADRINKVFAEVSPKALRKLSVAMIQQGKRRTPIPDLSQLRGMSIPPESER